MTAGVGSISGRVTENGEPLGGVRLTASNGDTTAETTSLTEGDRGSYTFPQLAIPGRYTVTASLEGYSTQTRLVVLDGNTTGVDFDFAKTTGAITGIVASSTGVDLPGANIRVSRDELAFDTKSAVEPDPGSFTITDLPPGTYLVEFSRYDHAPYSQTVTIAAGQVVDLGRVVLEFRGRPDIPQNGSLEVRVVNSLGDPLNGATVRVFDVSSERARRRAVRRTDARRAGRDALDVRVPAAGHRDVPHRGQQGRHLPGEHPADVGRPRCRSRRSSRCTGSARRPAASIDSFTQGAS